MVNRGNDERLKFICWSTPRRHRSRYSINRRRSVYFLLPIFHRLRKQLRFHWNSSSWMIDRTTLKAVGYSNSKNKVSDWVQIIIPFTDPTFCEFSTLSYTSGPSYVSEVLICKGKCLHIHRICDCSSMGPLVLNIVVQLLEKFEIKELTRVSVGL